MITNAFKRTAAGDIIDATAADIQGEMVSFTSHMNCGICGQMNTDLFVFGDMMDVSVGLWSKMKQFLRLTVKQALSVINSSYKASTDFT